MNQTLVTHFKSLLTLGVITSEQYQRATMHERLMSVTSVESDADALFRSVICGVVSERELEDLAARLVAAQEFDPGRNEKIAIVSEALVFIDAAIRDSMREPLDALVAMGLIDTEQHEAGLDIRPVRAEGVMDSPARALAILVSRGIVTEERLNELKAQATENALQADAKERLAVITEAAQIYHDIVGQYVKAMGGGALRAFGLIMVVVFGIVGLAVWLSQ